MNSKIDTREDLDNLYNECHRLFKYKEGQLIRKTSVANNLYNAGDVAGCTHKYSGYRVLGINKVNYKFHRIVFLMCCGYMPEVVDHIDGNILNNKIENLRGCDTSRNAMNQTIAKNNTSGFKGVSWDKKSKKWKVSIMKNNKYIYLGLFLNANEGAKAYDKKALEIYGEFSKTNESMGLIK